MPPDSREAVAARLDGAAEQLDWIVNHALLPDHPDFAAEVEEVASEIRSLASIPDRPGVLQVTEPESE